MSTSFDVAIIGAGLSGLTLALALHAQGISSTIYESRSGPLNIGGAVMLSPNALKITDALGFYSTIKAHGYNFDLLDFRMTDGTPLDTYEFGSATKYGYDANRIYRHELIDAILARIRAVKSGIRIEFGSKFSRVVKETTTDVTFGFADGTRRTASLLVGADGIHSTVRRYLYPDLEPQFTRMVGITAAVPMAQLKLDTPLVRPLTLIHSTLGAFVVAPQEVDGSEVLIGKQRRVSGDEPTREEWTAIHADKDASVAFLKENAAKFGAVAVNATSDIPHDKINLWPFYVIPKLERWASEQKRVIILGDAAHAIPPSAGQGINQAFEDVYVLALLLGACQRSDGIAEAVDMGEAMAFWQRYRQERVDKVLELNKQIDARRAPAGDDASKELAAKAFDLEWLFNVDFKKVVQDWVADRC